MIDRLSRGCIDDSESLVLSENLDKAPLFVGVVLHRNHEVMEIRAVEPGDDGLGIPESQLAADISPHLGRSRGGQRDRGRRPKLLVDLLHTEVAGAEIMTPLADAMRFVDREERYPHFAKALRRFPIIEPLGSD